MSEFPSAPALSSEPLQRASQQAQSLRAELRKAVIGQDQVIDDVLTALIAGGHVLLEGVPGWAKPCWYVPWRVVSTAISRASSSRPT
jgi:MoxR-like ATPase